MKKKIRISDQLINYASGNGKAKPKPEWLAFESCLEKKGRQIWDDEIRGFHILRSKVTLSFRYSYTLNKKRRTITIGRFPAVTAHSARKEAQSIASDVLQGIDRLQNNQDESTRRLTTPTLSEYLNDDYTIHLRSRAKSWEGYIKLVANAFPELLELPITDITKKHLTVWLDNQLQHLGQYGYASATIRQRYSTLKSLMGHAFRNDAITVNPFDKMERLEISSTVEYTQIAQKRGYLELDQQQNLLDAIDAYDEHLREQRRNSRKRGKPELPDLDNLAHASYHRPIYLLLYYTGMRQGDILGLDWTHVVDTPFKCAIVKVLEKTSRHVSTPYTIELPPQAIEALRGWRKQCGNSAGGLVFPSPRLLRQVPKQYQNNDNTRLCDTTLKKSWVWIKEKAGLHKSLQLYTLRHNYASWLILNNTPLKTVATMLGHRTVEMVDKHYGHLVQGETKKASDNFALLLSDSASDSNIVPFDSTVAKHG